MQNNLLIYFLILYYCPSLLYAKEIEKVEEIVEITESSKIALKKGHFVIKSEIQSLNHNKEQSLNFLALGSNTQNCHDSMIKLSRYEIYPHYLDFIKEVSYHEEKEFLSFIIDHTLLPFRMSIEFVIPRIKEAGIYRYRFDKGFLKDLQGTIELIPEEDDRCLFKISAQWYGPHTGIPDSIFELFSSTLTRVALEKMFRLSSKK